MGAMDLRQLEVFLAVIEHSSVTKAAESINLSPGAVSLQIHHLASDLRTDLFVRTGKRLIPTTAALGLAVRAKALMAKVREIENEFGGDPAADTRQFHFASGATTLIHRLGRPLRLVRKQYPNTTIQVTVSATEEMVAGLLERTIDLALISLPVDAQRLTLLPLFDEELLIIRPSAKPVRGWHVGSIEPAELAEAPFLLNPPRSNMRTMIDQFLDDLGVKPRVVMEAADTEVIKKLVESGFGYSILPEFALRNQPKYFQAFRVPGKKLIRRQALAMARTEHPRALIISIAKLLKGALARNI